MAGFLAVPEQSWAKACDAGMNHACTLITLAAGTGRDGRTTSWSATAVQRYTGAGFRRAQRAIDDLASAGVLEVVRAGRKPRYKLRADDRLIWLPRTVLEGAADEAAPIALLRSGGCMDTLRLFVQLYSVHDLLDSGGVRRDLLWCRYRRERLCERGEQVAWAFSDDGPMFRPGWPFDGLEPDRVWQALDRLEALGLLDWVPHVADGPDGEILHALEGEALDALADFKESLPDEFRVRGVQEHDYVLPAPRHMAGLSMIGVARLRYRPHTAPTGQWWRNHVQAIAAAAENYRALANCEHVAA